MKEPDITATWQYLLEHPELHKLSGLEGVVFQKRDRSGRVMNRRLEDSEDVNLDQYHNCIFLFSVPCSVLKRIHRLYEVAPVATLTGDPSAYLAIPDRDAGRRG